MWAASLCALAAQLVLSGASASVGEETCQAVGGACTPGAEEAVSALQVGDVRAAARRAGRLVPPDGRPGRADPAPSPGAVPESGSGGNLSAYRAKWRGMRRGLSPESEAQVAAELDQRYASPPRAAEPSGAVAIPFAKQGYGYYNMYMTLRYDGPAGQPFDQTTQGDSGFNAMQMCCWFDLDPAKYTVVHDAVGAPFGGSPAKIVRGNIAFKISASTLYKLQDVTFYACSCGRSDQACQDQCSYHGIGLGVGEGSYGVYSPLSPHGSAVPAAPHHVVRFDYSNSQLLLYRDQTTAPACKTAWMGVSPVYWTGLKVKQLLVRGKPVPNWVTPDTEAFLDTGGEMTYLQWGVGGTPNPFPKPLVNLQCPPPSWFHDTSSDPTYQDCVCYYAPEVVFSLAGAKGRSLDAVFSQAAIYALPGSAAHLKPSTTPTLVTCKQANVGGENWVNLGGVFFQLADIAFDFQTKEVCIEPRSAPSTTTAPPGPGEAGYCCYHNAPCPAPGTSEPQGCNPIDHYCGTREHCADDCHGTSFCPAVPPRRGFCCYHHVACPTDGAHSPQGCNPTDHYCGTEEHCMQHCNGTSFCPE